MPEKTLNTLQKALTLNLDPCKYGTIAEIGAGQEVARFFFQAGGAAGTVAKTLSAYDMKFSDAIYGEEENRRYVSHSRLIKMLNKEFDLILHRLQKGRPENSTFFAFADTVTAKAYGRKNECHGWMGVRLQITPESDPCDIILHVRMLDDSNQQQQEALGILGVNLIYGAYHLHQTPKQLIKSLGENMGDHKVEIDTIQMNGPQFRQLDNRLMSLYLIKAKLADAIMFSRKGNVLIPSNTLYKKNVLVLRGSFRPVTHVNMDMAKCGRNVFYKEEGVEEDNSIVLAEITTANLMADGGDIDDKDFLARADILAELGFTVLVSNYLRFFSLRSYLNRYTKGRIGIVLGSPNILDIFDEKYYSNMEGGILEAFGKLFAGNTRLYVYPSLKENGELTSIKELKVAEHLQHLYIHLTQNKCIVPLEGCNKELLTIHSREILKQLKQGDGDWKNGVPDTVHKAIVEKGLFGFPASS